MNLKLFYQTGFDRQEIKKEGPFGRSFQTDQLSPISWFKLKINITEIGGLAAQPRAIIDNLDGHILGDIINVGHFSPGSTY